MNKKERKERLTKRQIGERKAAEKSAQIEKERRNNIEQQIEESKLTEKSKVLAEQAEKLTFVQKLEIWTKGFTEPVLDISIVLSENKKAPKFSGIEEYAMYEQIKEQYNTCLMASKNDVEKAWKLFRTRYLKSRNTDDLLDEER